ncbi:hypothetical protein ACR9E3_31255 [Actinomycetospora sp. C-140]
MTGERGVGKSEVLRSFSNDSTSQPTIDNGGTIGVLISVPAAFDGIQFLKLALRRLAEAVPGQDELRKRKRRIASIKYLTVYFFGLVLMGAGLLTLLNHTSAANWRSMLGSDSTEKWQWSPVHLSVGLILFGIASVFCSFRVAHRFHTSLPSGRTMAKDFADQSRLRTLRLAAALNAQKVLERLRYSETISATKEGSLTVGKAGYKRSNQRSLNALPLTESDLVDEFRTLASGLEDVGYRICVCIDEMDKLEEGTPTENFLNSVKQLFVIRSCSFLVSVSSSAWTRFVRRGVELRDAFDSSLDTIESVSPMEYLEVRSLLRHRGESITDMQALLCYVLSGGLPREALRAGRSLAQVNYDLGGNVELNRLVRDMIDHQARSLIEASFKLAAASASADATSVEVELHELLHDWRVRASLKSMRPRHDDSSVVGEIDRVYALLRFFTTVESIFVEQERIFANPPSRVVEIASVLAAVRREIEASASIAEASLDRFEAEVGARLSAIS